MQIFIPSLLAYALYDKEDNMLPTHQRQMAMPLALAMMRAISGKRLHCACEVLSGITETSHHLETTLSLSKAEKTAESQSQLTAHSLVT